MIENLLDHECNIYRLNPNPVSVGYNLTKTSHDYPSVPTYSNVPCHFKTDRGGEMILKLEPQNRLEHNVILTLPLGTDIQLNDRVEDLSTGISYKAQIPRIIRGNHIKVKLTCEENI